MGQEPVFTRGNPDIEETVISDDENEPLGMPENMKGVERTPTRVQPMPKDVQDRNRPGRYSDVYEQEEQVQKQSMSRRWNRNHMFVYLSQRHQ